MIAVGIFEYHFFYAHDILEIKYNRITQWVVVHYDKEIM